MCSKSLSPYTSVALFSINTLNKDISGKGLMCSFLASCFVFLLTCSFETEKDSKLEKLK